MSSLDASLAAAAALSALKGRRLPTELTEALQTLRDLCSVHGCDERLLEDNSSFLNDVVSMVGQGEETALAACQLLVQLSGNKATARYFVQKRNSILITTLITILTSESESPTGSCCCDILLNLSHTRANLAPLAKSEAVVETLVQLLSCPLADIRFKSISSLSNIASIPELVIIIVENREVDVLSIASGLMAHGDAATVVKTSLLLEYISICPAVLSRMRSPQFELVLVTTAQRLSGAPRRQICSVLRVLSADEEHRSALAHPDLALVPILQHTVADDSIARGKALDVLRLISLDTIGRSQMTTDIFLHSMVIVMTSSGDIAERHVACEIIFHVSFCKNILERMASDELGLYKSMLEAVSSDDIVLKISACGFMWNLLSSELLRAQLCQPESGLLPALIRVVNEDDMDARYNALGALFSLTLHFGTLQYASKPSLGLAAAAFLAAKTSRGKCFMKAIDLIGNLTASALFFKSLEPNIKPILTLISEYFVGQVGARSSTAEQRCITVVANLMQISEGREGLCALPLLHVLVQLYGSGDIKMRQKCLAIFMPLSLAEQCLPFLVTRDLGLLGLLVDEISKHIIDNTDFNHTSLALLWNCSMPGNLEYLLEVVPLSLLSSMMIVVDVYSTKCALGILVNTIGDYMKVMPNISCDSSFQSIVKCLVHFVAKDEDAVRYHALGCLWNIAEMGNDLCAEELLRHGAHTVVLELVRAAGPDRALWPTNIISWAMNFLMNLAYHEVVIEELCRLGVPDLMVPILLNHNNRSDGVKAMFVLAFLVGKDDIESSVALLRARPETISSLVVVLQDTLDLKFEGDFDRGTFCLKLIIKAALTLSISDENKKALILSTPLLYLLKRVIEMYLNNEPEIQDVGGGSEDLEAVTLAIKTLLHLSFYYQETKDLRTVFDSPELQFLDILDKLIVSTLSPGAKLCARQLRQRLETGIEYPFPTLSCPNRRTSGQTGPQKHVMLSYCWHDTSRPHLVKLLSKELKSLGVEVWRDEEGSTLVPPVSGSIDHCMAQAVQFSDTVIICVSSKYKESINCQLEANYASHLVNKGLLKLCFVMMDADYTPHSSPHYCDGWLGLLIGRNMWYPLWDESTVKCTAERLAVCVGGAAKHMSRHAASSILPPPPQNIFSPALYTGTDVTPQQATATSTAPSSPSPWEIIMNPAKVADQQGLDTILNELGISTSEELALCDTDEISRIADVLKPIPRKLFLKSFTGQN